MHADYVATTQAKKVLAAKDVSLCVRHAGDNQTVHLAERAKKKKKKKEGKEIIVHAPLTEPEWREEWIVQKPRPLANKQVT